MDSRLLNYNCLSVVESLILHIDLRNYNLNSLSCCCGSICKINFRLHYLFYDNFDILNLRDFCFFSLCSSCSCCCCCDWSSRSWNILDLDWRNWGLDNFNLGSSDCLIEDCKIHRWNWFNKLNDLSLINWNSFIQNFNCRLNHFNGCCWSKSFILNSYVRSNKDLFFSNNSEILLCKIERLYDLLSLNFSNHYWLILYFRH